MAIWTMAGWSFGPGPPAARTATPEARGERAIRPAHAGMSSLPHLYNVARTESMRGQVADLCQAGKMLEIALARWVARAWADTRVCPYKATLGLSALPS